jgi:hypothetical protein
MSEIPVTKQNRYLSVWNIKGSVMAGIKIIPAGFLNTFK